MAEETRASASLPDAANLDWLRKQAKRRLKELRETRPDAQLADAQFDIARQYGFASWRALKAHVDSLTIDGQLFASARTGDAKQLAALLDAHPDKLHATVKPYDMTLLHAAAHGGHLAAVDLLLRRGLDPNTRETGDNTYAMHWAAAAGSVDVVRRLADAGGDVVGHGDDHALEVIGWASCWDGGNDDAHRGVVDLLLSRGAHHHIFSAIALNLPDEVRRLVAANPAVLQSRMSRNENNQTPLHFAVRMHRPAMVALLLELGADPLAVDSFGMSAATYGDSTAIDGPLMKRLRDITVGELSSADRGARPTRGDPSDLVAVLALADWQTAERLARDNPALLAGGTSGGVLHVMAKRGDVPAVRWLLEHGASPSAIWAHFDSDVTPLHLAILSNHPEIVRLLLAAGADPRIHDTKHDADAMGWATFFGRGEIVAILQAASQ
ncbi:MAG TPA: ankyrin repeat domain-containing protein [Gemmatimonadaceae bacterium]|nr:ankyrin repeat domain-containing protein [Gemmatimonadaceae bacterium]